jgi:LuxR family maltose regulon positive regulatory protein
VISWSLGWGHYCAGRFDDARRWLAEAVALAPPSDQWIVGVAALADLSLVAGLRERRAEQLELAQRAVALAAERGLLDAREVGEIHTAHGAALVAGGRLAEGLAALERGVFLRRLWGQPLDLADGLIARASAVAAAGDDARAASLWREAEEVIAGCPDPGVLPDRLAAARRPRTGLRHPVAGSDLSARELSVLQLLDSGLSEREIGRELYLSFNTVHRHVRSVYRKLDVSSRTEAVALARERRLIARPDFT